MQQVCVREILKNLAGINDNNRAVTNVKDFLPRAPVIFPNIKGGSEKVGDIVWARASGFIGVSTIAVTPFVIREIKGDMSEICLRERFALALCIPRQLWLCSLGTG